MIAVPSGARKNEEQRLLPLQEVYVSIKAQGAFASVDLNLEYLNPSAVRAIEATYEFPLEKHMTLAKLEAEIDGRTI